MAFSTYTYVCHSVYVASEAYSSPSVVLAGRRPDGSKQIIDDFWESYDWLRQNTDTKATIMSWWDYGYQITGMANRTVLVDNNTWNNTHIATVGRAMASPEKIAYETAKAMDAKYVLVLYGGMSYYSGDDISKFIWMIRIGGKFSNKRRCISGRQGGAVFQSWTVQNWQRGYRDNEKLIDVQTLLLQNAWSADAPKSSCWIWHC